MIVGYSTGVFDMFHVGHLRVLERARRKCDELVVGVATDELAAQVKGKLPIVPFEERREIVAALRCVDRVITQRDNDKMTAWEEWGFDILFKGDDWKGTAEYNTLELKFAAVGVEIVYFPYTKVTSSTVLRESLESIHGAI